MTGAPDWGALKSATPVDAHYGARRGTPVDRYYIERFLDAHRGDVRGQVLESAFDEYTRLFGGPRVRRSDVIHAVPGNRHATIVGDFTSRGVLAEAKYDCILLTQTLQCVFDLPAAIRNLHGALRSGGTLLVTVPGVARIDAEDMEQTGDYWRFTTMSLERLLRDVFGDGVEVASYGNLIAATAYLHGIAAEDLKSSEIDAVDSTYQLLIAGRAVRN